MRVLTGYLPASSGKVTIGGNELAHNSLAVRRRIGYLPEVPPLYPQMSVKEYLTFAARLKDVPSGQIKLQVEKVLSECHLKQVRDITIANLSLGYKQRVGIAQAIINDPDVLILDEPTKGLDPIQILHVRNLIRDLREKRTVLLSTHILSEIEQMAHRVLMINKGEIIADDTLDNLLHTHAGTLEEVFLKLNQPAES